jgi:chromate transporter
VSPSFAVLVQIALRFGGLSFVAVGGGNALVPAVHATAVTTMHWLTDAGFAEAVGLSQAAPGPNMLLMPLIGWQTAGIAGALVALVAFLVPSSTIAVLGSRLLVRHEASPAVRAFRWALRPVTTGLMVSAGIVLIGTAVRTWPAAGATRPGWIVPAALAALAAAVAVASVRTKRNPLVWLALAACIGALAGGH